MKSMIYAMLLSVLPFGLFGASLATALDNTALTFTTGGDVTWTGQTSTTHDGVDAAQSGSVSDSQSTYFQTTVSGAGTISFWWKVSSELNYDKLHFYVDGSDAVMAISGEVGWTQVSYTLSSGSHTLKWSYEKDGSVSSGSDYGWVDQVVWLSDSTFYTVTFNANGGRCLTSSKVVAGGDAYGSLPTPARSFYKFLGWYTSQSGGDCVSSSSELVYSSNHTLYAHWAREHQHSFSASDIKVETIEGEMGGEISIMPVVLMPGDPPSSIGPLLAHAIAFDLVDVPVNSFSRSGYDFTCWKVYNACVYPSYGSYEYLGCGGGYEGEFSPGEKYEICGYTAFVAQWTPKSYTVNFDANGGSCLTAWKTVTYDSTFGTLPTPTWPGYRFLGWYTESSGETKVVSTTTVSIAANQTLYAHWAASDLPDPLSQALDNVSLEFSQGGYSDWTEQAATTHDGVDAAQSGSVSDSQSTYFQTTVSGAGTVSFWWKVSSELNYDKLHFYVDGSDAVTAISGEVGWTQVSYTLSSGSHTLKWSYEKDGSEYSGSDCGWVDQVSFTRLANKPIIVCDDAYSIVPGKSVSIPIKAVSLIKKTTVTVSGLPSGLKFSKGKIIGKAKKPGTKTITVVAKNSKGTTKKTVRIVATNPGFSVRVLARTDGVSSSDATTFTSSGESVSFHAGVKQTFSISSTPGVSGISGSGAQVTVKGLPSGLKYKSGKITGVATAAGVKTATITFKNKWGWSRTFRLTMNVMSLRAAGSYGGYLTYDWTSDENSDYGAMDPLGIVKAVPLVYEGGFNTPVKVSVTSAGKITAKVGTVVFAATGFTSESNGIYRINLVARKKIASGRYAGCYSSKTFTLAIDTNLSWEDYQLKGYYYTSGNSCLAGLSCGAIVAQKNPFGRFSSGEYRNDDAGELVQQCAALSTRGMIVSKYASSLYEVTCLECVYSPPGHLPVAALKAKVSTSGVVTLAGKIAGLKVSGSSILEVGPYWDDGDDEEEEDYGDYDGWTRYCFARFILKPNSSTTIYLVLWYMQDSDYGFYSPCGWAKIIK